MQRQRLEGTYEESDHMSFAKILSSAYFFYFWEIWNLIKNYLPFLLSEFPVPPLSRPLSTSWLFSDNPLSPVSALHICMSGAMHRAWEPTSCCIISMEWFSIPSSKDPLPIVPQCGLRPRDHRLYLCQNVGSLDLGTVLCRCPKLLWVHDCHSHIMSRRQHSTAPLPHPPQDYFLNWGNCIWVLHMLGKCSAKFFFNTRCCYFSKACDPLSPRLQSTWDYRRS